MTAFTAAPRLISLGSGAVVALEEYGAPQGIPVFFFHGWPSAAVQGALLHEAAADLGVRVLALSRPGVGASSPQPGRRLLDWPPLLREIAAALELKTFRVLGISGGGPYVFASAWALPDLIAAATVICGAPPLAELGSAQGLNASYRTLLAIHRRFPWVVRLFFRLLRPFARKNPPPWMMLMLRGVLVGADRDTLSDPTVSQLCHDGFRQAWGAYPDGVFEDAVIYTLPWGFALEEIRIPMRIWHGTEDRNFSHTHAEYVASRLPQCELHIMPGEGHYSLPIRRCREILADLIAAPQATQA